MMSAIFLIPLMIIFGFLSFVAALVPNFGRLYFATFASWWWPWRDDSAATLIAAALDLDESADQWRRHGYECRGLSSTALLANIERGFDGELKLCVDGRRVPLNAWDDFKLGFALERWSGRANRNAHRKASLKTAASIKEKFGRNKSERTGA